MKKLSVLFMFCVACDSGLVPPANPTGSSNNTPTITTSAASSQQCPNGGTDITITSGGQTSDVLVCNGANGQTGAVGADGQTGATGATGDQGETGTSGQNAPLPVFSESQASEEQCPTGGEVLTVVSGDTSTNLVVCNGATGSQGLPGQDGTNGTNGVGVVFTEVQATADECPTGGYVLILASDTDGTGVYEQDDANQESAFVCNGATGATGDTGATGATGAAGQSGVTAFTVVNLIAPCGNSTRTVSQPELLECLADGNVLADFSKTSGGDLTRLAFLTPGTYQTTDANGTNNICTFTVASDGNGGLTVSWKAQNGWAAGSYDCANTTVTK